MTEVLSPEAPPTTELNGQSPPYWKAIRQGEYQNAKGETIQFDVMSDGNGAEKMLEKDPSSPPDADDFFDDSAVAPTPETTQTEPASNWREQLTPVEQKIQNDRDNWEKKFPGRSYLTPEGPSMGPEDVARLEAEAKEYGFDLVGRGRFVTAYEAIRSQADTREATLRQLYETNYPGRVGQLEEIISRERQKVVEQKQLEATREMLPNSESDSWRERRRKNKQRQKLLEILEKNPDEFAQINADWQAYEDILRTNEDQRLRIVADKEDKSMVAKDERSRLGKELDELNEQNGGALEHLAGYFVDDRGQVDDRASAILKGYKEQIGQHEGHERKEDLLASDKWLAAQDLKWRLGEIIAAKNSQLTDEQVKAKTGELDLHVSDWLDALAGSDSDPAKDLEEYGRLSRAYEIWDKRRRQAVGLLVPIIMGRSVERKFYEVAEKGAEVPGLGKILDIILDPNKIAANNGANALRHSDKLSESSLRLYKSGIIGRLQQAAAASRNQEWYLKPVLYANAFALRGTDYLVAAWEKRPPEEQRKAMRRKMYGIAAVGARTSKTVGDSLYKRLEAQADLAARQLYLKDQKG